MTQMKEALLKSGLTSSLLIKPKKKASAKKTQTLNPKNDGVTHVNLNFTGKSKLGREIGAGARSFIHPVLGEFANIHAMLVYVFSEVPTDELRTMARMDAVRTLLNQTKLTSSRVYRDVLKDAYRAFLNNHPSVLSLLIRNALPFESYYLRQVQDKEFPVRPREGKMMVEIITELQQEYRDKAEPVAVDYSAVLERIVAHQEPEVIISEPKEVKEEKAEVEVLDVDEVVAKLKAEGRLETVQAVLEKHAVKVAKEAESTAE